MAKSFIIRSVSFLFIMAGIVYYQYNALGWKEKEDKNKAEIAEIEAYNKKVEKDNESSLQLYNNGIYTASATGFGGSITVETIINNGNIEAVNIKEAEKEDKAYLNMAMAVVDAIIEKQSADVDTVSGATYSSTGIREAVRKALAKAE